jgi:HAE1 family hydrophobic/amphiphilic exporter-1
MSLTEISVRRHVFAWMLMSALIIFGAICFGRLGVSLLPDVDVPNILVQVTWPGAAPEVMETEVVDQIEQALVNVSGIKNLNSTIFQGSANISLEFYPGRNADAALLEVQTNISRVRLPREVDDPLISKTGPNDREIMWLGVSSDTWSLTELTVYAERFLRDKFQILPGVGQLILSGFAERNLRVWVDHAKLAEYELTVLDVQNALRTQHIEQAAGLLENERTEINVRLMGEGMTPAQVGDILIKQRGGQPIHNAQIRISDVATIEDGLNDVRSISKIDGVRGGGLGFRKQRGANSIAVADRIKSTLAEIRPTLPPEVKITINYDESKSTREFVEETEFTLILSAILTALICWLFLGSLSSTFNVVMSIPTSVLGSFMILYFLGFTLNLFTLLALSLAIGVVVDDAIMVLENIVRHYEMGKDRVQAAIDGTREITGPALASTLAIIAVFLPIAFVEGVVGQFLFQFGVTISAAVALSLVEAITLTPMRCSQFLSVQRTSPLTRGIDAFIKFLTDRYRAILPYCLHHRFLILLGFAAAFGASLWVATKIPGEFSPAQDQGILFIQYETPVGSSLAHTEERIREAEKIIQARPETNTYFLAVGRFFSGNINNGIMFVDLVPRNQRDKSQQQLMQELRPQMEKIEGLKTFLVDLSKGGPEGGLGYPITFSIQGPSLDVLKSESARLIEWMKSEKLATDLNTDFKDGQPELRVFIDREAAAARGVLVRDISDTIAAAIGGVREGKFTNDDRRYDVRIRLQPEERQRVEDLNILTVRNIHGEIVPVKDVVRWEETNSLQVIARRNRERSITITGNPAPGVSENEVMARVKQHALETLPTGYRLLPSQTAETNEKFGRDMMMALSLSVLIAYMILAAQFNSFGQPFLILLAMPFALSGAALGLYFTGQTWNLYSLIGLLLLFGIVKKNSILLVEFTDQMMRRGDDPESALLKACPIRLRPVLMTSFATMAAALPPSLALGPGAESRIPMGLTILCGSAVSMLATLFIVPCCYSLLESFKAWVRSHLPQRAPKHPEAAPSNH